jgi:myo-inositol-hexaphosphate 3-phosphohydrolase
MRISKEAYGFIKRDSLGNQLALAVSKDGEVKEFKIVYKNKKEMTAQQVVDLS